VGGIKACVRENETAENGSTFNVTFHRVHRLDPEDCGKNDNGWP